MKRLLLTLVVICIPIIGFSQVGINTTSPDAQLDIKSSNQVTPTNTDGILIPKIDAFPVTNPTAAQNSMMVYLTTVSAGKQPGFYYWDNATTSWKNFGGGSGWSLTGNSGTTAGTNFLGTTDANDLVFKRDNVISGKLGLSNTTFGVNALASNVNALKNIAIGPSALYSMNFSNYGTPWDSNNVAIGYEAMYSFVGEEDADGMNVAVGTSALYSSTIGNANTAMGNNALYWNTTGGANTAIGASSLISNILGSSNTAVGSNAIGYGASGSDNTGVGTSALESVTGDSNTALGAQAGRLLTAGNYNIIIGAMNDVPSSTLDYQLSIGNVIYGADMSTTALGKIGIGVPVPTEKLEVAGKTKTTNLQLTTGAGLNYMLTSDAVGNGIWQNPSTALSGFFWSTTGNTGIDPNINFIGTTDDKDVVFHRDFIEAGRIGMNDTSFGRGSLRYNTGSGNAAFGNGAMGGNFSGFNSGVDNTAIGWQVLGNNKTGSYNAGLGRESLSYNEHGSSNTAFGRSTLANNTNASKNVALGQMALLLQDFNNGGTPFESNNVAVGAESLYSNKPTAITNGINNTGVGNSSLRTNSTGSNNAALGFQSGNGNTSGSNNITVGANSNVPSPITSDQMSIGNVIYGATMTSAAAGKIGIGVTVPTEKLEVAGKTKTTNLQVTTGAVSGSVLTSDATGNATWQNPANVSWSLSGNAITAASFLGSTNNFDVIFKRNAVRAGILGVNNTSFGATALNPAGTGVNNSAFGANALQANAGGNYNTGSGTSALYSNTSGNYNTANGFNSLWYNTSGQQNTAYGVQSLFKNDNGQYNTSTGTNSLYENINGSNNTANGHSALYNNKASNNTAMGYNALVNNTTGHDNVALGVNALNSGKALSYSVAIGNEAMYYANNTTAVFEPYNVAVGYQALRGSTNAANNTGVSNTAIGVSTLFANTSGRQNTAIGDSALDANTTGDYNTASGAGALGQNISGSYNNAYGVAALIGNITGNFNIATGFYSLSSNDSGSSNIAIGVNALYSNSSGSYNTGVGNECLVSNSTSSYNAAFGWNALHRAWGSYNTGLGVNAMANVITGDSNTVVGTNAMLNQSSGSQNTAVGMQAQINQSSGNNNTVIGYNAQVPSTIGSNQVRIGDFNVAYAGVNMAWTISSDKRLKENIQNSTLGLDFINKLNPVTYTRKNDDKKKTEFGFIAQELEQTLIDSDAKNNGIITVSDDGMYGVRYNDLISISVKAIQEQQEIIQQQNEKIKTLETSNAAILKRLEKLENK